MPEEYNYIAKEEVDAFMRRLEEWSAELDPKEKVLLQAMLSPPEAIREGISAIEQQGFQFNEFTIGVPLVSLLNRFRYEPRQGDAAYIKGAPEWVRFIQHKAFEDPVYDPADIQRTEEE
jgi:hypothetical protein